MKRIIAICVVLAGTFSVSAQNCEKVYFTGKVVDTLRPQSFYNLMVINRTSGRGVFGRPNGTFSVYANDGDSITLSVRGYPAISTIVNGDNNCQHIGAYFIENKAQEVQEVVVKPLKSLEEIKEQREALAMRETRQVTGIEVMQSPITALYQAFSKKERNKRWIAQQEHKDNQQQILQDLLRTYVAYEVIDLSSQEFEDFIAFLNVDETFLKTASEMELITFIQDKLEHYLILNPQIKRAKM